jgi:hypothetical protein
MSALPPTTDKCCGAANVRFVPKASLCAATTKQIISKFIEKASQLYEQKCSAASTATALEMYVWRWLRWANGGLVIPRVVLAINGLPGGHARMKGGNWQIPLIETIYPD